MPNVLLSWRYHCLNISNCGCPKILVLALGATTIENTEYFRFFSGGYLSLMGLAQFPNIFKVKSVTVPYICYNTDVSLLTLISF